jgi:hypothetical protein
MFRVTLRRLAVPATLALPVVLAVVIGPAAVRANPLRPHYLGPPYIFPGHHPGPPLVISNPCCYGYYPTQWRPFPAECQRPGYPEAAPAIVPAPHELPAPAQPAPAPPPPPAKPGR